MDQAEQDQSLIKLVEWLLDVTKHSVSPDAYLIMLKVANSCVLHVFRRCDQPHAAELFDLGTAVGIICSRRRSEARYGLHFLREALAFREEDYAQPIVAFGPQLSLQVLIDAIYAASQSYSSRYVPPNKGSFTNFEAYYSNLTFEELLADAQALPSVAALNRLIALFERLIDLSCWDQAVAADDRWRAAQLSGAIEDQIRRTQLPDVIQRFEQASQASFDNLIRTAPYPDIAERLRSGEFSEVRRDGKL